MLMIRLQRVGRKNDPSFRLVVTEKENSTKSGKFLEILGSYDARHKDKVLIDKERITHWISKGAQPTDSVRNLLIKNGVISGKKVDVSKKPKKEGEAQNAPAAA